MESETNNSFLSHESVQVRLPQEHHSPKSSRPPPLESSGKGVGILCLLNEILPKFAMICVETHSKDFSQFYIQVGPSGTKPFVEVRIKVLSQNGIFI